MGTWDDTTAINLGLTDLSEPQCKLMSGLILTKPVSPWDAALALLNISVVETSVTVTYINTCRPGKKKVLFLVCAE